MQAKLFGATTLSVVLGTISYGQTYHWRSGFDHFWRDQQYVERVGTWFNGSGWVTGTTDIYGQPGSASGGNSFYAAHHKPANIWSLGALKRRTGTATTGSWSTVPSGTKEFQTFMPVNFGTATAPRTWLPFFNRELKNAYWGEALNSATGQIGSWSPWSVSLGPHSKLTPSIGLGIQELSGGVGYSPNFPDQLVLRNFTNNTTAPVNLPASYAGYWFQDVAVVRSTLAIALEWNTFGTAVAIEAPTGIATNTGISAKDVGPKDNQGNYRMLLGLGAPMLIGAEASVFAVDSNYEVYRIVKTGTNTWSTSYHPFTGAFTSFKAVSTPVTIKSGVAYFTVEHKVSKQRRPMFLVRQTNGQWIWMNLVSWPNSLSLVGSPAVDFRTGWANGIVSLNTKGQYVRIYFANTTSSSGKVELCFSPP